MEVNCSILCISGDIKHSRTNQTKKINLVAQKEKTLQVYIVSKRAQKIKNSLMIQISADEQ